MHFIYEELQSITANAFDFLKTIICQVIKNIAIEISQYPKKFNIKSTSLIVQPVIDMLSLFSLLKILFFSFMKQKMTLDRMNELLFSKPQMWMVIYTAKLPNKKIKIKWKNCLLEPYTYES